MTKVTKQQGKAFAGVLNSLEGLSVEEGIDIIHTLVFGLEEYGNNRIINPSLVR